MTNRFSLKKIYNRNDFNKLEKYGVLKSSIAGYNTNPI